MTGCLLMRALVFFLLILLGEHVFAGPQTVKVGFFAYSGYHEISKDGKKSGYGYDLLRKMSRFANLNYEFVGYDKTWDDMLDMLKKGDIDLVSSARMTKENDSLFSFSLPVGKTRALLSVRADDDRFDFDSVKSLDGLNIGLLTGNSRNLDFERFANEHHFTYNVKYYHSGKALTAALQTHEVDAIASRSLRKMGEENTLAFFEPESFYIIVRKSETKLLDEINYAIRQMDLTEPNWRNQLYYKYYGNEMFNLSRLSMRERAFLKEFRRNYKTVKVTVQNAKAPFAYMEDGVARGIFVDIFADVANRSDLKYEFVPPCDGKTMGNCAKNLNSFVVLDGKFGMEGGDDSWVFTPQYMHNQVLVGYDSLLSGYRMAVPRDFPRELASILTNGVLMSSPRTIREIVTKYVGFRLPNYAGELLHEHSRIATVFGGIFGFLGIFLIGSLVWLAFRRKLKNREDELDFKLREANAFANEAKEAKSKFLLNMSHDIRTPMNAIIGYAERAERHLENRTDVQDALRKIRISGGYLLQLIEEVLDMAKIESGQIVLKERMVNLTSCMTELCKSCEPMMKHKNISFIWDFSTVKNKFVVANVNSLRQVLYNVISNAQKFTTYGGRVVFTVEELPCRADGFAVFHFEISDNGLGMSKEFLDRIYDEFAREQSSTQSGVQGTGLGMSIVKRLVDLMGAEIEIQSEIGLGTTVHIRAQFKIATERDVALDHGESAALENAAFLKGKRVLLVEDNEFNREVSQDFLNDAGMVVEVAENGLEAVSKVREHPANYYDCILMDIQMPVMDGYEATKAIRKMYPQARIPVIALSANAFEEDRQKSISSGMDEHLAKPFVVAKVLGTMSSLMRKNVNVN